MGVGGKIGEGVVLSITHNELVLTFGGFYVCANFGENPLRNASVRVHADGQTDREATMSHAICYSYRTDNNIVTLLQTTTTSITTTRAVRLPIDNTSTIYC